MLRISNLSKHFGEPPFFENFDLLLSGHGFMVLTCCIHDFAEDVLLGFGIRKLTNRRKAAPVVHLRE